jgi:HEAT repeat protein
MTLSKKYPSYFPFVTSCIRLFVILFSSTFLLAGPADDEKLYTVPQRVDVIHPRMAELMDAALGQPDELTRLEALSEIARLKLTTLAPKVVAALGDKSPLIRVSAARVVDDLDLKAAADSLVKWIDVTAAAGPHEIEQALLADKLLARWKDSHAVAAWAARLDRADTLVTLQSSAAASLGEVAATDAAPLLTRVVTAESKLFSLRLAAADALARIAEPTAVAESLAAPQPLLAARLLTHASSPASLQLLGKLATNTEPAVAFVALNHLLELDPKNVWPLAPLAIQSADPKLRLLAVQCTPTWHDLKPVGFLAAALDDPHPAVRTEARAALRTLAAVAELKEPILAEARKLVDQAVAEIGRSPAPHWRAGQQAALLLGELDDKPTAPTLVKLFDHARLEVRLGAVIALRSLDVASTRQPTLDLLGRLLDKLEQRLADAKAANDRSGKKLSAAFLANIPDAALADEVSQTMGAWRMIEADPVLRRMIPKGHPAAPKARSHAVWALGFLHENKPDESLGKAFVERLFDLDPLNPEAEEVRIASAIAIGRMKDTEQNDALHNRFRQDSLAIRCAARWSIMHMTDEKLDEPHLDPSIQTDAFISPKE